MADFKTQMENADTRGKKLLGDDEWSSRMQRLGEYTGGIPEGDMRRIIDDPDVVSHLANAGADARLRLLQRAQDCRDGNPVRARELEAEYSAARAKEREAYRKSRGR